MSTELTQAAVFAPSLGLAEQIADHVQNQIVSGELTAGERIAEARITEQLGVSRGPVRESMRVLARRHLVDLEPRKGAKVSDFGIDDVNALYDMQQVLLKLLVRKVGSRWDTKDLERFATLQQELGAAAEESNALKVIELSFTFQRYACELTNNSYLSVALVNLQPSFSRAYYRALSVGQAEMRGLAEFINTLILNIVAGNLDAGEDAIDKMTARQRKLVNDTFSQ